MDPMTEVTVAVIQFAQQVNKVSNSWILNFLWHVDTWLYNYHRLSSCLWGFINDGAHVRKHYRGEFFPNSSSISLDVPQHLLKGSFFFLHADIQWLLLLIGLIYLAFRDKVGLSWVTTLTSTPENRDGAQEQGAQPHSLTLPHCPSQE